ncbi:MAG: hypothetical protein JHC70_23900 [Rhodococcus sp.]|nr:hypothetical protein [Rhodococcus sp. (in: high G+C Gram-positive bacteria)]MBJ7325372.1 hypothetical protein [Rhodococcus sp. (in: high G+C Gram-positive bacteria)]
MTSTDQKNTYNAGPPRNVTIPQTVEELRGLATARAWERAAWVYAFTEDGRNTDRSSEKYTITEFADLGIAGLRSPQTVKRYRDAWERATEDGRIHPDAQPKPGDVFALPELPWPYITKPKPVPNSKPDAAEKPPFAPDQTGAPSKPPSYAKVFASVKETVVAAVEQVETYEQAMKVARLLHAQAKKVDALVEQLRPTDKAA